MNASIQFIKMQHSHLPLWYKWVEQPHVKSVWLIEGYETADYINQKIEGNGYLYPFVIEVDGVLIGYIQACDLYAYRTKCEYAKGLFTNEDPGTFCMDLFIGEEQYLDKGYGTAIVKAFCALVGEQLGAKRILIDPAVSNKHAIRCYEKAGFRVLYQAHDSVMDLFVMEKQSV